MEVSESASGAILSMGFWQISRKLCRSPSCPLPSPCLHASPSHPHSAHLRRTCPGRVQRRRKERVTGTRVVILWGPWSPFLSLAAKVRGDTPGRNAESTDPSSCSGRSRREPEGGRARSGVLSPHLSSLPRPSQSGGQNYSPGSDSDTDNPTGSCSSSPGAPEGLSLPACRGAEGDSFWEAITL